MRGKEIRFLASGTSPISWFKVGVKPPTSVDYCFNLCGTTATDASSPTISETCAHADCALLVCAASLMLNLASALMSISQVQVSSTQLWKRTQRDKLELLPDPKFTHGPKTAGWHRRFKSQIQG